MAQEEGTLPEGLSRVPEAPDEKKVRTLLHS